MIMNNIADYVAHWASRSPQHEAIIAGERRISYGEFERAVAQTAGALEAAGLKHGDRIAVQSLPTPEYLILYMAAVRLGAVLVGINAQYTADEIGYLLELSRPTIMLAQPIFVERLEQALAKVAVPTRIVIQDQAPGWTGWDAFAAQGQPVSAARTVADDAALIVFTSGTTGKPKGAVLTHRGVLRNIEVEVRRFSLIQSDRVVLHLPMNHVAGATEISIGAIMAGATLLVLDRFHPATTLELVAREKATFLGQVPAMFIMELNLPNFADYDLSSLTRLVVAGAATPAEVMKRMMGIAPVITGYGMSEVGGFVTYTDPRDDAETVARTVGRIAPEFALRVVGEQGQDLPAGEIGDVWIKGECLMQGYFGNAAASREALTADGWYRSGDMGKLDERGYLTLVGRRKEMYISGGYNVYPVEIEDALARHPDLMFSAVIGVPDAVLGEVGKALVVPRPGRTLEAEAVQAFLRSILAEYKIPRVVEVVAQLPMTPLGKVDKKQLHAH